MKCAKCGEELNGMPMNCPHCGCMLEWNVGCATHRNYVSDYGGEASDYQTTMAENPSGSIDYDSLTRGKLCPLKQGIGIDHWRECDGLACAWYDQTAERCAVLSIARDK